MTGFLSRYSLASDPFVPQQVMPQGRHQALSYAPPLAPPDLRMPEMREERQPEVSISDIVRLGSRIFGEEDPFRDAIREADALRRSIPPLPDYVLPQSPPEVRRSTAMAPTDGPDLGDINPNAGIPRGYFARLQGPESGGNASIRNKDTGAGGLYQFLPSTWKSIMQEAPHLGLTETGFYDASPEGRAQQDRAIRYFTDQNLRTLASLGRTQPTMGELYALHFLGPQGGSDLLKSLDRPVSETVSPLAVKYNPWLKSYLDKPGRALLRRFDQMMG